MLAFVSVPQWTSAPAVPEEIKQSIKTLKNATVPKTSHTAPAKLTLHQSKFTLHPTTLKLMTSVTLLEITSRNSGVTDLLFIPELLIAVSVLQW